MSRHACILTMMMVIIIRNDDDCDNDNDGDGGGDDDGDDGDDSTCPLASLTRISTVSLNTLLPLQRYIDRLR